MQSTIKGEIMIVYVVIYLLCPEYPSVFTNRKKAYKYMNHVIKKHQELYPNEAPYICEKVVVNDELRFTWD
jgi:hypothetical protein